MADRSDMRIICILKEVFIFLFIILFACSAAVSLLAIASSAYTGDWSMTIKYIFVCMGSMVSMRYLFNW